MVDPIEELRYAHRDNNVGGLRAAAKRRRREADVLDRMADYLIAREVARG